ncbi:MAG: hypothetical protein KF784_10535 [Fimbriimonadaceae bacterium]|nr:hypothetical protein [Fimbriimonadaceae bacterium]
MKKFVVLMIAVMTASGALSQVWSQPWTRPLASWESVVRSCDNPKPYKLVALDDFYIINDVLVSTIVYWGTVSSDAQLGRPMYYAVYKDNGNCQPDMNALVWSDCLKPYWEFVDGDCTGQKVFRFKQPLNPWNYLYPGGAKLWLQISEDDAESAHPDRPDFAWSAHQRVNLCPAVQVDYNGMIYQPLIDPCNGRKDDLAFELY